MKEEWRKMPSIWQDLYKVFQPKPLPFCLPKNRYDTKKSTTPERHAEKQAWGTCGTQRFATLIWGWTLGPGIRWTGQCFQQRQGQNLCSHGNLEYPAILPCSYLLADAEIQNTMRKLFIYSKSKVRVLGTVIVPVRNPRSNVEYTEEWN